MSQINSSAATPPRNSDEYLATLMALGPGLAACGLMGAVEFFGAELVPLWFLLAYSTAVLAFLPGLPVLGFCLARATGIAARRVRLAWLFASLVAPIWHVILADMAFRIRLGQFLVNWPFVARYDACLWVTTAVFWGVWAWRTTDPCPAGQASEDG